MLAYVFWHWSSAPRASYEEHLRGFHRALAAHAPDGFGRSAAYRIERAPWASSEIAYEDWYTTTGFTALGTLRDAAVSAQRKGPHDTVARLTLGGTAGVYELVAGAEQLGDARFATWFAKPAGMTYAELFAEVRPWIDTNGAALWQRQLVLGPTPELCMQSRARIEIPARFAPIEIAIDPVV